MFEKLGEETWKSFSFHKAAKPYHVILIVFCAACCFFLRRKQVVEKKCGLSTTGTKNKSLAYKISTMITMFSVCFLGFSIVGSGLSSAATVYIATDGSGDYNCDGINDHIEINEALTYIDSLGGGTVYLKGSNTYWIDSTLVMGAKTILTGDSDACVKLVPNADTTTWGIDVPMIRNIYGADNLTVTGFEIDANSESQSVSRGKGYHNMIYFNAASNVEVSHMRMEWGCGDGLKIQNSNNIKFIYNDVYKLGHEAFYSIQGCSDGEVAYNTVYTRTNCAFRLSEGATDFLIHDNVAYSAISSGSGGSTGQAIQLSKDHAETTYGFNNIDIYDNKFYSMYGTGIWMYALYNDNTVRAKNVHIHHNTFTKVGQLGVYQYNSAGIVIHNFDNTTIENNVFDDCGAAAIMWYPYPGDRTQTATFTTTVRNNVIMNSAVVSGITGSGAGILNTDSTHSKFIVQNNDVYNNRNEQTYGGGCTLSDNLNTDPLFADATNSNPGARDYHLSSKAGRYSSGNWIIDTVTSPLIDAGYPASAYSNEPDPNSDRINIGRYGNTAEASKSIATSTIDNPPVANAGADKTITTGSVVSFDGSASTDDKGIASYSWDFDASNGITSEATGITATKIYATAGTYTVTLTVTDTGGQISVDTLQVVGTNPVSITDILTYDNRLREATPTTVLSTTTYIDVGKSTSRSRDVMWFDLGSYNTTDAISKATLSLYWYYPAASTRTSDAVVEIYRPVAWDPEYVTWKSRASGTSWTTAGGNWYDKNGVAQGSTPYSSVAFPAGTVPGNKYYDFDVTQLVQEYVSGKYDNTGFFLKAKTESGNYIAFYSSEWSNAAQRPKLTVSTGDSSQSSGSTAPHQIDAAPVANAGADQNVTARSTVSFDASASTDDIGIGSYSWDFDASNGITSEATGKTATKTYTTAGTYTVTLTITDSNGQTATDTLQVFVTNPVTSITYTPTYDNRLREATPTTVLSTTTYIDMGKSTFSSRDVMWFDLSDYKTKDEISKATLSLYWYYPADATRTSDTVVEIYRPLEWDPKYVSWKSRASGTLWSTPGGNWYDKKGKAQGATPYASITFPAGKVPDNRYYEFDVTGLVQEYVSGKYKNTGFFIKAKTENGNYIAFYSSDWSDAAQKPKLTVTLQ